MPFQALVLFDGFCPLCDHAAHALFKADRNALLRFAPLQGKTAQSILSRHPELAKEDSIVLVEDDGMSSEAVFIKSEAVLRICGMIGGPARLVLALRLVPRWIRDAVYQKIAEVRYEKLGKRQTCTTPGPEERGRFLP